MYLQEGSGDAENESECTIQSDHNRECAETEWQNQGVYPLKIFNQTNILTVSLRIILGHNMNNKNVSLCSELFMKD
jgi:hypothetical protein